MRKMIVEAADLKTRLVRPPSGRAPVSKKGGIALSESGSVLFDPANFLANVGAGKTILKYQKDQAVYSQGDVGDAVFYILKGKIKLAVVSKQKSPAANLSGTRQTLVFLQRHCCGPKYAGWVGVP